MRAVRGDNLISWRLSPSESRPRFAKARVRYYDRKAAKWKQEDVEVGASPGRRLRRWRGGVIDLPTGPRADKDQAKSAAKGRKTASEREGGSGEVTLVFAVEARAEGTCVVEDVRAGIDGSYRIESVVHRVSRGPSTTTLQLKQPQGETGNRRPQGRLIALDCSPVSHPSGRPLRAAVVVSGVPSCCVTMSSWPRPAAG